ncbi:hypothetical protein CCR85_02430 [Rhodothalassium salexigens]|uniref:ribokinase n=1 Tax=Rhodothalassium salexigens TaxID=1086 RepID=UPI001914CF9C|nr:ribokinase [Rhodothalassium salexigens]MBK5910346.1 hypothetical protein [Rhodothalassium salexigens]
MNDHSASTDHPPHDITGPTVSVVGSINLDMVAHAPRLPLPGESVTDAQLAQYPGGKGANQALAARRLGARVVMHGGVGQDPEAKQALSLLRAAGIDLSGLKVFADRPTGLALIVVAENGDNQIVVAPGANRGFTREYLHLKPADAVICQMEIPRDTLVAVTEQCGDAFFCLNLSPVREVPQPVLDRADLIVVNEVDVAATEPLLAGYQGLLAITKAARGADLKRGGETVASAAAPKVKVVDTTGAGDAFTAALTLALLRGDAPAAALAYACAAGSCAAAAPGTQHSFPDPAAVADLMAGTG